MTDRWIVGYLVKLNNLCPVNLSLYIAFNNCGLYSSLRFYEESSEFPLSSAILKRLWA
jgi:hypothetical protein